MRLRYTNRGAKERQQQGIEPKPPRQIIVGDRANNPHSGIFQGKKNYV